MKIAVWPNGQWCELSNVEHFRDEQALSDDYATHTACSEDEAERIAERAATFAPKED